MGTAKIIIDQMTLFRSYVEVADLLPDNETRGEFYSGLAHYALDGEEPKFTSPVCNGYFLLIKPIIDKSNIRRRAGSIGGEAKAKQTESKTEAKAKQTESKTEAKAKQTESKCEAIRNRNRNMNKENSLTGVKETPDTFSLSADESAPPQREAAAVCVSCFSFDEFWELYNHKRDKAKCETRYKRISEADRAKIKAVLPGYVAKTHTDGSFPSRKHPLTWLNGQCWNDEDAPAVAPPVPAPSAYPKPFSPEWYERKKQEDKSFGIGEKHDTTCATN